VLDENRFLAARDGARAQLLDPVAERKVALRELLEVTIEACRPHAAALGCETELEAVEQLAVAPGADRQRSLAGTPVDLVGLTALLSADFVDQAGRQTVGDLAHRPRHRET
jgi:carboxylate-amine ligase